MQTIARKLNDDVDAKPWYQHRWPWLLMLGPAAVVVAGVHTTWIAFTQQDALVVDDYYKQGKAINHDLRRDRTASGMAMEVHARYDAAAGKVVGTLKSHGKPLSTSISIHLVHSTQPEKDVRMLAKTDSEGNFAVALPMLDMARWQVLVESGERDWRLKGVWSWPQQKQIDISADPV